MVKRAYASLVVSAAAPSPAPETSSPPVRPVSASTTATSSAARRHARNVGALGSDLDETTSEEGLVEDHGVGHQRCVGKLDVCVATRGEVERKVSVVLVQLDC